ncbi:hypothetical protein BCR33DRAFT_501518 [Rhizoclosmatium globosum]|uniref:GATA-type domain-containing protein n=1 Tax=Rhizoclosmatium globosum TaxID=329046 RepID=A0A1Y2CVH6_9FUNG|nr:hypothetical protein BCR33DRAFT_501518 [Rhizoclosmatium globosum]|eukprot:ORY51031.1 hypothetical protein BCR33DRAFT_501518 [Rhizoclosmatium globosum]
MIHPFGTADPIGDDIRSLSYSLLENTNFDDHWLVERYTVLSELASQHPSPPTATAPANPYQSSIYLSMPQGDTPIPILPPLTSDQPQKPHPHHEPLPPRKRRKVSELRKKPTLNDEDRATLDHATIKKREKAIKKKIREENKNLVCVDCNATKSPFWRKSAEGLPLCNACGEGAFYWYSWFDYSLRL